MKNRYLNYLSFFEKKSLISFGISEHLHLKLSGDFADCVHFEASFGRYTVHQGSFSSSRTTFQMLLHHSIICNTTSSTISRDLSQLKVSLHTFSIFLIIEFNRLFKNMFDMLAIISDIKQTIAMTS